MLLIAGAAEGGTLSLAPALAWESLRSETGDPRPAIPSAKRHAVAEVGGPAPAVGAGRGWLVGMHPANHLELVVARQVIDHPAPGARNSGGRSDGPLLEA